MLHRCECHDLHVPSPPSDGLALRATSAHIARRCEALLGASGAPVSRAGDALIVPASAFAALDAVLRGLSVTERAEVLGAPLVDGRPDAWHAAPLAEWVERLNTPWFATVTDALCFHLQPVVHLPSGTVFGYEALVRARHGEGLLGAAELLGAAAAHGRARAFDALARREAIRQAFPRLAPHEVLCINFAPGVVYNPDICLRTTFEACRAAEADFTRLLFEVTESEAFPDVAFLKRILDRYRAEGARVALDDLGAGHTSLSYLGLLRPDFVKLDRALVRGLHDLDPRVKLVGALVRYAHDLDVRVVAEGIETEAELRLVLDLGADYAQGYFLGRPSARPGGVAEPVGAPGPGVAS